MGTKSLNNVKTELIVTDDDDSKQSSLDLTPNGNKNDNKRRSEPSQSVIIKEIEKIKEIKIGEKVDVLDGNNRWYNANIVKLDINNRGVYVTFENVDDKFNEWIPSNQYYRITQYTLN